jgi:hypothetical protein
MSCISGTEWQSLGCSYTTHTARMYKHIRSISLMLRMTLQRLDRTRMKYKSVKLSNLSIIEGKVKLRARGSVVVKAISYKLEGRRFDTR